MQDAQEYNRYCPGQEQVKISDAICRARRRSNFPKCKDCPFNEDSGGTGESGDPILPDRQVVEEEKIQRDKIELVFQNYHVRGLYPDQLDAETSWRVGQGIAQFLRSELRGYDRAQAEMSSIVVGRDMRKSSHELAGALIEGLRSGGSTAIDIGMIDTGQLYFAVNHLTCCGGVQVTASHETGEYNGFIICGQKGKLIWSETGLGKIGKIALNTKRHSGVQIAGMEQIDLSGPYKQFIRRFLKPCGGSFNSDRPLKLVVDASNGMAGRWIPLLFGDLDWLEITRLNFEHNGDFHHHPEPLIEANLTQLKDRMRVSKADLGLCFDGDADRCVFVDKEGKTVRPDILGAVLARYFLEDSPGSSVVYDLRSSRSFPETINESGGVPRRERSGHAFVRKSMSDSKSVFGAQLGGRYYFRDNAYCDSGMLTLVHVLNLLTEGGRSLHELSDPVDRYVSIRGLVFENSDPSGTIQELSEKYGDGRVDFLDGLTVQYDDWWFNLKACVTGAMLRLDVEACGESVLESRLGELRSQLGKVFEE
ncbi:MAG: phosphomannomutase/phosphoglucomutase [Planctomycetota bacterium]